MRAEVPAFYAQIDYDRRRKRNLHTRGAFFPFSKKKNQSISAQIIAAVSYIFYLIRALRAFAGLRDAESWAKFVVACVIVRAGHGAWGLGHEAWGMGHAGAVPRSPRAAAPPRRVSARFKNYTNEPAQRAP